MRTTIEMAREAAGDDWGLFQEYMPEIHRLVELVRADERARMATDKSKEAMKLALEALEYIENNYMSLPASAEKAITALREAMAEQPDFITHSVEQPYDWSEWVCPDPKSYLMKCCDCGLVHEAQFGVVRYKSETEREDCEPVDDPNLQAVFRMRRSEQWSPKDTAHRAGGLPMEQPAQQQEPEPDRVKFERHWRKTRGDKKANRELPRHQLQPQTYIQDSANRHWVTWQAAVRSVAPPAQRKPLTDDQIWDEVKAADLDWQTGWSLDEDASNRYITFARAIEAAHGIKENT